MKNLVDRINQINPWLVSILLYCILVFISILIKDSLPLACDIGEYVNNPLRILNGEKPYLDFWLLFSPGEVYFPALIYKIFGVNTDILRIVTIFTSCLSSIIVFRIAYRILNNNIYSVITTLLFFYSSVIFFYEGPDYINLYLTFILLSTLYLIKFIQNKNLIDIGLSGFFIGIGFYFRVYESAGAMAGLVISLVISMILLKTDIKSCFRLMSVYLASFIFAILLIFLVHYDIALLMFHEVIIESVKNGTSMNIPYFYDFNLLIGNIKSNLNEINASSLGTIIKLFIHLLKLLPIFMFYLLPFLSIIIFLFYLKSKPEKLNLLFKIVFLLLGLGLFPKGIGRSDVAHLAPSAAPLMVMICFIFFEMYDKKIKNLLDKWLLRFSLMIILIMSVTLLFPIQKLISLQQNKSSIVRTEHGSVSFKNSSEVDDFRKVAEFLKTNIKEGDNIFVTPWDSPAIYALFNLKNPTYYDSMNDLVIRESKEKQNRIINKLKDAKVKYVIHNPDWGYDSKSNQSFRKSCPLIETFIVTNYRLIEKHGFYHIYEINYIRNNNIAF